MTRRTVPTNRPRIRRDRYAPVERQHHMAGLFSAIAKTGERTNRVVRLEAKGETWRFVEPWSLGADDQTVFLTILAMFSAQPQSYLHRNDAIRVMNLRGAITYQNENALYMPTTARALCAAAGWEWSGPRWALLRKSLDRLSHTTFDIIAPNDTTVSGGTLLARRTTSEGQIALAINPLLGAAIGGEASWIRVDLDERKTLKSNTARLLHAWLSGWLWKSEEKGLIGIDTLGKHIWPDYDDVGGGTRRKRRHHITVALEEEISPLPSWKVKVANGVATISHSPRPVVGSAQSSSPADPAAEKPGEKTRHNQTGK